MSLHRSLKTKSGALEAHRSVLSRPERIAKLKDEGRFDDAENEPIHLVKVRNIKVSTGKKKKTEETAEGAEGAAPAAAPAAAAPAGKGAAGKGAAGGKGGKGKG